MATPEKFVEAIQDLDLLEKKFNTKSTFQIQSTIRRLITEEASRNTMVSGTTIVSGAGSATSIFHGLVRAIANYNDREVHDMKDLILRDNKTLHGLVWEVFCRDWLRTDTRYTNAWLLCEVPSDILRDCGLCRLDSGIDLIAELRSEQPAVMYNTSKVREIEKKQGLLQGGVIKSKYVAIQCKFREPNKDGIGAALTWKMLDTFTGLCSMTGPWARGIIMTNGRGIGNRVPKKALEEKNNKESEDVRDQRKTVLHDRFTTFAFATLNKTDNDHWKRMAGTNIGGDRLGSVTTNNTTQPLVPPSISPSVTTRLIPGIGELPVSNIDNSSTKTVQTKPKTTTNKKTRGTGVKGTGRRGRSVGHVLGGDVKPKTQEQLRDARLAHYKPNTVENEEEDD